MSDDKIIPLPGAAFNRHIEEDTDIATVLESVSKADLIDVAVVGRERNGNIVVWGTANDADRVLGLFHRGLSWLSAAEQVNE